MTATAPIETWRLATLSIASPFGVVALSFGPLISSWMRGFSSVSMRRSVGDHRAVVEREHAVGVALDDIHVVLDEQHGDARAL